MPFSCYLYELWSCPYDAVLTECTMHFRHADLVSLLGHLYDVRHVVFSPSQIGLPVDRSRKYCILLRKEGPLKWRDGNVFDATNFLNIFCRRPVSNGHIFLSSTPASMVDKDR